MPEHNQHNRADQGLNTKTYMIAIIIGTLAILAALYFFVAAGGPKTVPKANKPNPNSRLVLPAQAGLLV